MESGEFEPLTTSDGRSMRTGVIGDLRSSVRNIRRAYGHFYAHPPEYPLTRDAALRILTGIIAWWKKNAAVLREVAAGKRGSFIFSPTSAHLLAHDFAAAVGECVLPILKDDAAAHEQALTWLRSVERDGFDPSLAWMGLLAVGKMEAATVADRVSRLVLAATRMEINDGSWLITSWYRAHRAGQVLAGPPTWLVDLLAHRVIWRVEPALGLSCDWLALFIREWGEVISTTALSLLLQSLEVLLQTTDFEGDWQSQSNEAATRKEAHRMMDLRTSATGVASALYRAATRRGGEPHPVLVRWAKLAADHTLPEIRRAWRE